VFGRLAHVPVLESTAKSIVKQGINGFLIPQPPAGPGSKEQVRCPAHAFHPAGNENLGVCGANGLGRKHNRLESGTTGLVDCDGSYRVWQTGLQGRLARRVLSLTSLKDKAHKHFFHLVWFYCSPPHRLCNSDCSQLGGRQFSQATLEFANWSAGCGEKKSFSHVLPIVFEK
jgi:hypothetical protein